jgi:hypothetical protein
MFLAHKMKGPAMLRCNPAPSAVLCPALSFVGGVCAVLIAITTASVCVLAQESLGFADPGNIQPLLDYRLPDWGYRNWELGGSLGAGGDDVDPFDRELFLSPQLNYMRYHESEGSIWQITGDLSGRFNRAESPTGMVQRATDGNIRMSGRTDRYFRSPWFYSLDAGISASYDEYRLDESNQVRRRYSHSLGVGLGHGRLRDVMPLLRAQRISERLRALGRDPLPASEVERLADLIAQEGGYRIVFDRADRHFWGSVFEILEAGRPFTAYEVLYLTDVMLEDIGQRYEGRRIALFTSWDRESSYYNMARESASLEYSWYHNHSLNHQLGLVLRGFWSWTQNPQWDERHGSLAFTLQHLWVVADRILWSNSVGSSLWYDERVAGPRPRRYLEAYLTSRLIFYVEDRWSIRPELSTSEILYDRGDHDWLGSWSWRLGVTVSYRFGAGLF